MKTILLNFIIALGYCAGGYAGSRLAIPPAYVSPIWPAAGVALAVVLLYGRASLPGLAAGILLTQFLSFADNPGAGHVVPSPLIALCITAGSLLQALAGTWLIRRRVGWNDPLLEDSQILRFLVLGGPVSCITAATVGTATLYAADMISGGGIPLTWGSWWVGDTLGVLVVTPMLLILLAQPRQFWSWRIRTVVLPMLTLLVAVMILFRFGYQQDWRRISAEFQRQVNLLHLAVTEDISDNIQLAHSLKAFFDSSTRVTESDFHTFAVSLLNRSEGTQALEWIPRATAGGEPAVYGADRADIIAGSAGASGHGIPARQQGEHFLIRYLVPYAGNERALGFDVGSNPLALDAVRRARDSGQMAATPPVRLVQDSAGRLGTVLYEPVYDGRRNWDTVAQRREHFRGVVATVFRISDRVTRLLATLHGVQLNLAIDNGREHLYSNLADAGGGPRDILGLEDVIRSPVADREWTFTYQPAESFFEHHLFWNLWWLLLSGFLFTGFTGAGLMVLTGHTLRNEDLIRRRTRQLEQESRDRQRMIEQRDMQNEVLRNIAGSGTLENILELIVRLTETADPHLRCSILLVAEDGRHLEEGASPSLPAAWHQVVNGLEIAAGAGPWSTAVTAGTPVIAADVHTHPCWANFRGLAEEAGIAASWSEPVHVGDRIAAVFTILASSPGEPDEQQQQQLHDLSRLTALAIEQKQTEARIQRLAFYDMLTDLPNRRLLLDRLDREIASARRHGTCGAVLFIDLDNFKTLNDSLGHQVGDQLLVKVAHRLRGCIREEDTAARHGGDEFVILMPAAHTDLQKLSEDVLMLARRIQDDVEQPYQLGDHQHHISPSIGVTFYSGDSSDPDEVLKQADTAMYSAKSRGRNTVSYYHPDMQRHVDHRLQLERDLRTALREEQFTVLYQPQYDGEQKIVGAEALLRWNHPQQGMLTPDAFIPLTEENRMIIPLGEWVVEQICRQLEAWPELGYIAVNISPVQLHSEDFVERMRKLLLPHETRVRRLMLEMTEGIMVEDVEGISGTIQSLQKMGIGISIDDFGRGYSSLVYLKNLPLDQLKIDKGFISEIETDPNGRIIVETIIAMARHLRLDIIAEGVETHGQLDFLREQGCSKYQGYYFSYPLTVEQFGKLLRENHALHTGRTLQ